MHGWAGDSAPPMQYESPVGDYPSWSRGNALAVVVALTGAAGLRLPAVLGAVGGISLALLVHRFRGAWTAAGKFGLANAITSLRLGLTLGLLACGQWASPWLVTVVAVAVVSLDGVDGWAARRFRTQGEFGGRYDTAVDALFTLALSLLLFARGVLGPWVLLAGLWHYLFVLALVLVPSEREAKRSTFGASVFVALTFTLGAAFVLPAGVVAPLVGLALGLQSLSFLRSFWEVYGPG